MIGLPESVKILLFVEPTDMRKGFDGLGALVARRGRSLRRSPLRVHVFLARRRDRAKILTFQKGGFVLGYKRLEMGRFRPLRGNETGRIALDATQLAMLLDGIDIATTSCTTECCRCRSVRIESPIGFDECDCCLALPAAGRIRLPAWPHCGLTSHSSGPYPECT